MPRKGRGSDTGSENQEVVGTFETLRDEGEHFVHVKQYAKAIESFTRAIEMNPEDKNCLVTRSKCWLQLGNAENALADAEEALTQDREFIRALYSKAEAMYQLGDFETALVFFHRGHKQRPELQEFRLGIQKAQEAINNSIGMPESVKLSAEGDLTYFYKQEEDDRRGKDKKKGTYSKPGPKKEKAKERERPKSPGNQKTIKQLLGELYGDKEYLEILLKDPTLTGGQTSMNRELKGKVCDGLDYLDSRADFWRQQKPMYARKRDKERQRKSAKASQKDPTDYLLRCLEEIDEDQVRERYEESLSKAKKTLKIVENMSDEQLQNKSELLANIHSQMGNAYLEIGKYSLALEHHEEDLRISNDCSLEDAKSRALDNLGRVYARKGNYEKAIEVWEEKLPMSKSPLESTWLYHEIGRCYLELEKFQDARDFGEKSLAAAREAEDDGWQLHASVLVAQSEVKLGDLQAAADSFDKSLELAKKLGDRAAEDAITKAQQEVNSKIVQGVKDGDEQLDSNSLKEGTGSPEESGGGYEDDFEDDKAVERLNTPAGGMKSPSSRHSANSPTKRSVSIKETTSPAGRDSKETPISPTQRSHQEENITSDPRSESETKEVVTPTTPAATPVNKEEEEAPEQVKNTTPVDGRVSQQSKGQEDDFTDDQKNTDLETTDTERDPEKEIEIEVETTDTDGNVEDGKTKSPKSKSPPPKSPSPDHKKEAKDDEPEKEKETA